MAKLEYGRLYLEQYGWSEGNPLQNGGLSKPILVKHKFDQKGLGSNPQDNVAWWERVFDGQLKSMQLGDQGFQRDEKKKSDWELEDRRRNSPLYKVFVKGQGLQGSIKEEDGIKNGKEAEREGLCDGRKMRVVTDAGKGDTENQLMVFDSDSEDEREAKRKRKKAKKEEKKLKKAKKEAKRSRKEAKEAKRAERELKKRKKTKSSEK